MGSPGKTFPEATMDNEWRCQYCGRWYVVGSLARDCEHRHETDTAHS